MLQACTLALSCTMLLVVSAGCLAPSATDATVWVVDDAVNVERGSAPSLENAVYSASRHRVELSAAINETVAFQVVLRADENSGAPLDVRVTNFAGPGRSISAAEAVKRYRVEYVRVADFASWYSEATEQPAIPTEFPDALVPWEAPRGGGPVRPGAGRDEIIWLDLHVPITAGPGTYQAQLIVAPTGSDRATFTCDVVLNVLPVALPGRRALPILCRVDPRELLSAHFNWPRLPAAETRLLPNSPSHAEPIRLVSNTMGLLHDHRLEPFLWASFPKFRVTGDRTVEVRWDEYDRLVEPWLDGTAFPDRARLEYWPIPATLDYPNAVRNGGLRSPRYARLLASYLAECRAHFQERGWLERSFLRCLPPDELTQTYVNDQHVLSDIVRASESALPIVAHLPPRSLAGFGWRSAPHIKIRDIAAWAPSAMWYEPAALREVRRLGQAAWFMPNRSPYSGSLALAAAPEGPRVLAWQAHRYGVDAIWIEHAADSDRAHALPGADAPLVLPGDPHGLRESPVPTVRLKRLRRGAQDYELLRLLEDNGKRALASEISAQIARWGFTDACHDNLLDCRPAGWSNNADILRRARELTLHELAAQFEPSAATARRQVALLTQWGVMMNQAARVQANSTGVRLRPTDAGLQATVHTSVLNVANRPVQGHWQLASSPVGWDAAPSARVRVGPAQRQVGTLEVNLTGISYNADGAYLLQLAFDTEEFGKLLTETRLAVAACPRVRRAPVVDGRLDDWPLAANNALGDLRLCRWTTESGASLPPEPAAQTQAYVVMADEHLYIAVRNRHEPGAAPIWEPDNNVPIDGNRPWGQDVVEILLDPQPADYSTRDDLYCLQIKPSGLLIARRGPRTEPQMGRSVAWPTSTRVAVSFEEAAWVIEMAIPLRDLDPAARNNTIWGMNVTRLDARRGEYSTWSAARGDVYTPNSLGNLIMLW